MIQEYFYESRDALTTDLTRFCLEQIKQGLAESSAVSMLLSGGSTPKALYENLAKQADVEWSKVTAALVDERWVDADHKGSNETFLKQSFASENTQNLTIQGMKTPQASAAEAAATVEETYLNLPESWSFTLLGMGPDSHTASLFPLAQNLEAALDLSRANLTTPLIANQSDVTGELTERMTLTLKGILKSDAVILLITGQEKRDVYEAAKQATDITTCPIAAVLQQSEKNVHVFWAE